MQVNLPEAFTELATPMRYKCFFGGRGSGKSHSFATMLLIEGAQKPLRILCGREVQLSIKDSVKQLLDDKIRALGLTDFYTSIQNEIRGKNGTQFIFAGLGKLTSDQLKSIEGIDRCWIEEAQTISDASMEILIPTIRKEGSEIWFSWNPRHASDPVDARFRGEITPDEAIIRRVNYSDNPFFPTPLNKERVFDQRAAPTRYGHIWLGEYEPTAVGAIWDRLTIHQGRRAEAPTMDRIVVAVDPAISNEVNSDEHGIIVAGTGQDGRGYVLDDVSMKGAPKQWAERAIAAYDRYDADAIVIEINQGGDMVRHTIESVRKNIRIIEVRASRGKHVRAEPISALYHMGLVSHVGVFQKLEDEMCQFTAGGYDGEGSPDHCLAEGTLVETSSGPVPIEKVSQGDLVATRKGFRRVLEAGCTGASSRVRTVCFSDGTNLTGTVNHPVYVKGCGFLTIDALVWGDSISPLQENVSCEKVFGSAVSNMSDTLKARVSRLAGIFMQTNAGRRTPSRYTAQFGKTPMAQPQWGATFITKMVTHLTTTFQTWWPSRRPSTLPNMKQCTAKSTGSPADNTWTKYAHLLPRGTVQKRDSLGTKSMVGSRIKREYPLSGFVSNVARSTSRWLGETLIGFAPAPALAGTMRLRSDTMSFENVMPAAHPSKQKKAKNSGPVPISVVGCYDEPKRQKVFNLAVEDANEYYANGILVHNCDALVWAFTELMPSLTSKIDHEWDDWDDFDGGGGQSAVTGY